MEVTGLPQVQIESGSLAISLFQSAGPRALYASAELLSVQASPEIERTKSVYSQKRDAHCTSGQPARAVDKDRAAPLIYFADFARRHMAATPRRREPSIATPAPRLINGGIEMARIFALLYGVVAYALFV